MQAVSFHAWIDYLEPVPVHPGSGLDLYWTANWGKRRGTLELLDYGSIAIAPQLSQNEPRLEFRDPAFGRSNAGDIDVHVPR